jgi:ADP-heptose:LPS heptosyltransferase
VSFDPRNILVIDFGQLGDVVMSLPALRAIRDHFPKARISVAVGKPGNEVVEMCGYADATIVVDRVSLRDGFKPVSVLRIFQLVKEVRRKEFDFVIDLHSLSETNLLGFLSGAPKRLFSRRPGRSLDFLSRFHPLPPVDRNDPKQHLTDRYLAVLEPLGIRDVQRLPRLTSGLADDREVDKLLRKTKADADAPLIGLFPGAGHVGRRWPLERFAELADFLVRNDGVRVVVFVGPEERALSRQMREMFPSDTVMVRDLSIRQLVAAQARLSVFVSNDTGPMHLAAAVGTPIVMLSDHRAPDTYVPINEPKRVIRSSAVAELSVEEVYAATRQLLVAGRMTTLFAS